MRALLLPLLAAAALAGCSSQLAVETLDAWRVERVPCASVAQNESYLVAQRPQEWARLWAEACRGMGEGPLPVPALDLANHTAAGAFWGPQPGGHALRIVHAEPRGDDAALVVVERVAVAERCPRTLQLQWPGEVVLLPRVREVMFEVRDLVQGCAPAP